jgi:hypothetical protein
MPLDAFLARFPKGTRMRVSFELMKGDERESFQVLFALTHMVNVGGDSPKAFMRPTLREVLDGLVKGFEPGAASYAGWAFDPASLRVDQIPSSGKSSEVIKLLGPVLAERFPAA